MLQRYNGKAYLESPSHLTIDLTVAQLRSLAQGWLDFIGSLLLLRKHLIR